MEKPLGEVSLSDIYGRLGRVEDGQAATNESLSAVALSLAELAAGLDGPVPLKERVNRLESWRDRLVGAFSLLTIMVTLATALGFLMGR